MDAGRPPALSNLFDTSTEGYALYVDDITFTQRNLARPDAGSSPELVFEGATGDPSPGSLKATVTFTDYAQYIFVVSRLANRDLSGRVVHARVRLTSGAFSGVVSLRVSTIKVNTDPNFPPGGSYSSAYSPWTTLAPGTWTYLVFDLATVTVSDWTPSATFMLGVVFSTGDAPATGAFAGPVDAVFHLDSIVAE